MSKFSRADIGSLIETEVIFGEYRVLVNHDLKLVLIRKRKGKLRACRDFGNVHLKIPTLDSIFEWIEQFENRDDRWRFEDEKKGR
jgi:hypothetical protein